MRELSKIILKIKEIRIEKNMSQSELARLSGVNQSCISYLENRKRTKSPILKNLEKIAKALDVCVFDLMMCDDGFQPQCNSTTCRHIKQKQQIYGE